MTPVQQFPENWLLPRLLLSMRCIWQVMLSSLGRMSARDGRVNNSTIAVVYYPATSRERAQLIVTVRVGKNQLDEEHIAFQNFLMAVKRLQDAVGQNCFSDGSG